MWIDFCGCKLTACIPHIKVNSEMSLYYIPSISKIHHVPFLMQSCHNNLKLCHACKGLVQIHTKSCTFWKSLQASRDIRNKCVFIANSILCNQSLDILLELDNGRFYCRCEICYLLKQLMPPGCFNQRNEFMSSFQIAKRKHFELSPTKTRPADIKLVMRNVLVISFTGRVLKFVLCLGIVCFNSGTM